MEKGTSERANIRVGYRLWGGSLILSNLLHQLGAQGNLRAKSILEIGAGLGLCGLVSGNRELEPIMYV